MRRVFIVVALVVAAAVLGMWRSHGGVRQGLNRIVGVEGDGSPGVTGDETRKTFELKPGARIEIQGINGRLDIQPSNSQTAEVFVRRTADDPSSLRRREMIVEQTADGLLVKGRSNHLAFWEHLFGRDPKEEVTIKAPRQINLSLKGVNGNVSTSDIDGTLDVRGVNGRVDLGQAQESVEIVGINGNIRLGLKALGARGSRLSGINGNIELRLDSGLNADLTAKGMNGNVSSEIADVTVNREEHSSRYSARIGSGGTPISLAGINGNVRLTRAENTATAPVAEKKPVASNLKESKSSETKSTSNPQ